MGPGVIARARVPTWGVDEKPRTAEPVDAAQPAGRVAVVEESSSRPLASAARRGEPSPSAAVAVTAAASVGSSVRVTSGDDFLADPVGEQERPSGRSRR